METGAIHGVRALTELLHASGRFNAADVEKVQKIIAASDHDASSRGQERVHRLLRNYRAPLLNKADWRSLLQERLTAHRAAEAGKARLRAMWKTRTGNESSHPQVLDATPAPDLRDIYVITEGRTYGVSPFPEPNNGQQRKELLVYEGSQEWKAFEDKCTVEVGDVDIHDPKKKKLLLSLTLEKLIQEAEFRGASREQLGKIILSFLRAKVTDVATKINSHTEVTKECFKNLEGIVDIKGEIELVNKSMDNVARKPGDPISLVGNNYEAKQILLAKLRNSVGTDNNGNLPEEQRRSIVETTTAMVLKMVHKNVNEHILNESLRWQGTMGGKLTLNMLYKEITRLEWENPSWRITTTLYTKSMDSLPIEAQVYKVGGELLEEGEELDPYEEDEDDYEDSEDGEDALMEDPDTGEFYLVRSSGTGRSAGRPRGRLSRPRGGQGGRGQARGQLRPRANVVAGQGGARGLGRGAIRGGAQGRRLEVRNCVRCGSPRHLASKCPRFNQFCEKACPNCPENVRPLFHLPALCPYKDGANPGAGGKYPENWTGYKTPDQRSPASRARHGFEPRSMSKSPNTAWRRTLTGGSKN